MHQLSLNGLFPLIENKVIAKINGAFFVTQNVYVMQYFLAVVTVMQMFAYILDCS